MWVRNLILAVGLFFCSCASVPTQSVLSDENFIPTIDINKAEIIDISAGDFGLETSVAINNLLPLEMEMESIMLNLYYNDRIIHSHRIDGKNTLKPRTKSIITLNSGIKINDLVKIIENYLQKSSHSLQIEVTTTLFLNLKDEQKEFNLRKKTEILIPSISFDLQRKSENLFNLTNIGASTLGLKNAEYFLQFGAQNISGEAQIIQQDNKSFDIITQTIPKDFVLDLEFTADINEKSLRVRLNKAFKD